MEKTGSILEKLKALDEQRAKLLEGAKAEALEQAEKAIAALNELGFHYRLVDETGESSATITRAPRGTAEAKRQQRDLPCPVCGFKTTPLHDGRAHRAQNPRKPFTAEELQGRGLEKVE